MLRLSRSLRKKRLALTAAATLAIGLSPVLAARPAAAFTPGLQCPPEQFPPAGSPRSAASTPYQVPFDAELGVGPSDPSGPNGGYIVVNGNNGDNTGTSTGGALSVVLGPKGTYGGHTYTTGTLFGNACGYFSIPSLLGQLPQGSGAPDPGNVNYNHNFILHGPPFLATQNIPSTPNAQQILTTPIPVALEVPGTGVPVVQLSGTGSADGAIANAIAQAPAGNGGLNVSFDTSAKSTATMSAAALTSLLPSPIGSLLPPSLLQQITTVTNQLNSSGPAECTLSIGDMRLTGYPSADVGPYVNPVHVSTDQAASPTAKAAGATPVTGPISNATGISVSTGIIQPPIDSGTTPDPAAPGAGTPDPSTLCSPPVASLLNNLFGLPKSGSGQVKAADTFVAPVTFRAYATK